MTTGQLQYTAQDSRRYLNVSNNNQLATSRVGTDWTKRDSDNDVVQLLQMLRQRTRYPVINGCCSYSLLQVARGRLDGYVHLGPELFDFAAGAMIVEEVGGKVTDALGKRWGIHSESIVATNGCIHDELLEVI
jgi:myo-inositol-1(or 4)-monophosphatase